MPPVLLLSVAGSLVDLDRPRDRRMPAGDRPLGRRAPAVADGLAGSGWSRIVNLHRGVLVHAGSRIPIGPGAGSHDTVAVRSGCAVLGTDGILGLQVLAASICRVVLLGPINRAGFGRVAGGGRRPNHGILTERIGGLQGPVNRSGGLSGIRGRRRYAIRPAKRHSSRRGWGRLGGRIGNPAGPGIRSWRHCRGRSGNRGRYIFRRSGASISGR